MSPALGVAICGAGVSGSYLARLLENDGFFVEVYDGNPLRGHRCAYGSFYSLLKPLLRGAGLDLEEYILCWIEGLVLNGVEVEVRNQVCIDKPRLIEDIYPGEKVKRRMVKIPDELLQWGRRGILAVNASSTMLGAHRCIMTRQYRARISGLEAGKAYVYILRGYGGYAWAFPLDGEGGEFHLGAGCVNLNPQHLINGLIKRYGVRIEKISCTCGRPISVADLSRGGEVREYMGSIISVGEAAGAVFPITGEGVIPSFETSKWLHESLREGSFPHNYLKRVSEMLGDYRRAFNLSIGFLKHPHMSWLRGSKLMMEWLMRRSRSNLTPITLLGLYLKALFNI